jgi:predicted small metal-binding protein
MIYFRKGIQNNMSFVNYEVYRRCVVRELKCASLGYTCKWKHIANTEELLADVTAIHLRDVHGVKAISPDILAKIKNAFTPPSEADVAKFANVKLKEYNCDIDPKCSWRYVAMTEDLIVDGAAVHAREAHGIKEFTPAMIANVKMSAHEWHMEREKERKVA